MDIHFNQINYYTGWWGGERETHSIELILVAIQIKKGSWNNPSYQWHGDFLQAIQTYAGAGKSRLIDRNVQLKLKWSRFCFFKNQTFGWPTISCSWLFAEARVLLSPAARCPPSCDVTISIKDSDNMWNRNNQRKAVRSVCFAAEVWIQCAYVP